MRDFASHAGQKEEGMAAWIPAEPARKRRFGRALRHATRSRMLQRTICAVFICPEAPLLGT